MIDVTTKGVTAGTTMTAAPDCLAALQTILATLQPSTQAILYFPAGAYKLSACLDLSAFQYIRLRGDGYFGLTSSNPAQPQGTVIFGNFADDLIRHSQPGTSSLRTDVADMMLYNPAGTALHVEGSVGAVFERILFAGVIGLNLLSDCFDTRVTACRFNGPGTWQAANLGLQAYLFTNLAIDSCYFSGWTEALRLAGAGLRFTSSRLERNVYGVRLGMPPSGGNYILSGALIERLDMEANDTAIDVVNLQNSRVQVIGMLGSTGSPSKQSLVGINDHGSNGVDWQNIKVTGSFSQVGILVNQQVPGAGPEVARWSGAQAANSYQNAPAWSIAAASVAVTTFTGCNQQGN